MLHAATAWRYGYFRDELYFIACAKHLAWGYVDQPPMVAFAAWLAGPLGYQLVALRALPILAAALTVWLAMALARELGGGRFAQLLAGAATLLTPAYLLLGNTLTTTSFEPLFWTLAIYLAVRVVRGTANEAPRRWLALGVALALGAYCKYSIALAAAALAIGAALTPQRRTLLTGGTLLAAGIALVLVAPNLAWQATHGWPFLEVLRGDAAHRPAFQNGLALESRDLAINARDFALEQLLYTNPVAAPIWLAGLIAPFRLAGLRDLRFVPIAYAIAFVAAVALAAKGYYIVGFYAALFAIGAVALERATSAVRVALCALAIATGIAAVPLSLPLLPVDGLIAYTQLLGLTGRGGAPARLIQPVFAEEFGWERLARDVARVYDSSAGGAASAHGDLCRHVWRCGSARFLWPALRPARGDLEPEQLLSVGDKRLRRNDADRDRGVADRPFAQILQKRRARGNLDGAVSLGGRGAGADLPLPRSDRAAAGHLADAALVRRVTGQRKAAIFRRGSPR